MSQKRVKICTGPGCLAWEAEEITQRLGGMQESLQAEGYKVSYVPCMNKCGGGACVQIQPGKQLFKIRVPDEVHQVLFPRNWPAVA